eukprot:TRINITY_DN61_c0_g1_i4.p3 TRINITY_DN61_c0_g1~~TRINITY_DN61_c0_g1_i4.p3  ORF type:complete len:104 (+),score=40.56 TRINITY_DN61_c0_g1_i4:66-377(+)
MCIRDRYQRRVRGTLESSMSFGPAAKFSHIAGATIVTTGLCILQHQNTLGSGVQPSTVCAEWEAATTQYLMNRTLESNPDKRFLSDPISNTCLLYTSPSPRDS